jgi:hypothetical protein
MRRAVLEANTKTELAELGFVLEYHQNDSIVGVKYTYLQLPSTEEEKKTTATILISTRENGARRNSRRKDKKQGKRNESGMPSHVIAKKKK